MSNQVVQIGSGSAFEEKPLGLSTGLIRNEGGRMGPLSQLRKWKDRLIGSNVRSNFMAHFHPCCRLEGPIQGQVPLDVEGRSELI
jgi:hypothetical protein